jgi:cyclophilin family peptidyl-prolyl cis-trans isomerase
MANQQTKRRRKRYQPGSAFAGDVKPTGILSLIGGPTAMKAIFLIMALGLAGGGLYGVFRTNAFNSNNSGTNTSFVLPTGTAAPNATPQPTVIVRHYAAAPAMTIDPTKKYVATIKTSLGDITVDLLAGQAPQTVNNFVFLAKDGFYNGLTFYQVIADPAYVQAGDPGCQAAQASSSTCRGSGDPGYSISVERPATPIPYDAGTLGMSNASQFFIALGSSDKFAAYTPFGRITSGLDIAQQITQGTPIQSVDIQVQ